MDFCLKNKNILVTGASSGVGRELAVQLVREGATVGLIGRKLKSLEDLAESLSTVGIGVPLEVDLTQESSVVDALKRFVGEHGKVDGVALVAGVHEFTPLRAFSGETHREVMATNVDAQVFFVSQFRRKTISSRPCSIVMVSSVVSQKGQVATVSYAASKGAIESATLSMAAEMVGENIRVNCVRLGYLRSPMTEIWRQSLGQQAVDRIESSYPLGPGDPTDVAPVISFLLSPVSKWVTGSIIPVDGGYLSCAR